VSVAIARTQSPFDLVEPIRTIVACVVIRR